MATLFQIKPGGNWYINFRHNGRQIKKSTGTTNKKLAEIKLKEIELQLFKGEQYPLGEKPVHTGIGEFFRRYTEFSNATKSAATHLSDNYRIKQIQNYFARKGIRNLKEITPGEIQLFQAFILIDHNARSYNNFLNLLKSMLNKGVEWGLIENNPIKNCKPLKIPKKVRFFTKEEIERLYAHADRDMKLLLDLALYAGMRRSELYFLRWKDIDLKQRLIHIRPHGDFTPKNRKSATVPINSKLLRILEATYPRTKDLDDLQYVFHKYHRPNWLDPTHSLSKHFSYLAKKAGVENAGLHDCRHTFAGRLVQNGTPILVVKELLRHSDIQSTMIYAYLDPDQQRKAIEDLIY
ncbi:MAG: site-specific integrase [Candidatus Zixiibacteriota bacterium]|nr:MAG: site-specific integrase [candidate division Zixibacteria bacterium]